MADAKTRRDPIDEMLARSNVKENLRRVQAAGDDGWMSEKPFWIGASDKEAESEAEVKANANADAKSDNGYEPEKAKTEKGKTAGLEEKASKPRRTKKPKENAKAEARQDNKPKTDTKDNKPKSGSKDKNHWNDFLSKLDDRKHSPYKGERKTVLMPVGIINALQTAFGRRSSDVLSILTIEFFERERDNIYAHIKKRSNPNIND